MHNLKLLVFGVALIAAAGVGYAAGQATQGTMTASDELKWQPTAEGSPINFVTLWGDPGQGESGRLIKLPAGFVVPDHTHTGDYNGINLSGTWRHTFDGGKSRELPPGFHIFQPGKATHGDACVGSEDCVIFVHQQEKADFIPKE